ncbi:hypothetical protein LJK88_32205 [Paenibacillus sp. P26]|nr:hypothetical protein LJK88_32205 [Paenibacillus sp. P26]UUZ94147.1 hypothetical protein LJK87_05880 [Paenibacillus sp. P25]
MAVLLFAFAVMAAYEYGFLKYKMRKRRTFWIVFSLLAVSFLYNVSVYFYNVIPSPNEWIDAIFAPLQDLIT